MFAKFIDADQRFAFAFEQADDTWFEISDEAHQALFDQINSAFPALKVIGKGADGLPEVQDPPPPDVPALKVAVQQWLDTTAQASGYDSLASCASYAGSAVAQWAADAKAAIAWRDAVWQNCFAQWSAVQNVTNPVLPTVAKLIAGLPQPSAYGWTAHAAGA